MLARQVFRDMGLILNNLIVIEAVLTLVTFGVALRVALQLTGQRWATTLPQTMTFLMLPLITYAITSVISDNIALSLGMVGALSIVRFRNPVKSPYELALYFLSISLGICASVSLKICGILGIATIGLILVVHIINLVIKRTLNVNVFSTSFAEANSLNIVEVISTGKNESLSIRKDLISFSKHEGLYTYRIGSPDKSEMQKLSQLLSTSENVQSIEFIAE